MVGKPSIEVLDEFDRDNAAARPAHAAGTVPRMMVRLPELEGLPFHPADQMPVLLRSIPWNLVGPR
jgi:hypothetical protein